MGYSRAGFEVVGVDHVDQPHYPFRFLKADALHFLRDGVWAMFDAIHVSPPCQAYTMLRRVNSEREYPDLIARTRDLLLATELPFVIENVVGAPLIDPVMLCGSSFELRIRRHRLFECHGFFAMAPGCCHGWQSDAIYPALNGADRKAGRRSGIVGVYGNGGDKRADLWAREMGISWMSRQELTQAIPPAYCQFIGEQLLRVVRPGGVHRSGGSLPERTPGARLLNALESPAGLGVSPSEKRG